MTHKSCSRKTIRMGKPSHARAASLVLALSMVIGSWLFFEYSTHQANAFHRPAESPLPPRVNTPSEQPPVPVSAVSAPHTSIPTTLIYKCEKGGRIHYGDQPCGEKTTTLSVTATQPEPATGNNLQQLKERLAVMEGARTEREKATITRINVASSTSESPSIGDKKEACDAIDCAIAAKDSALRQPHTAQMGDYLTGERKKLTDQRFSLGC